MLLLAAALATADPVPPGLALSDAIFAQALSGAAPAAAPCGGAPICQRGLSAADLIGLVQRLIETGHRAEAERLLIALQEDADPEVRIEGRFRLGLLKVDAGQPGQGAALFRSILAERPGATRVRLELARALSLQGEDGQARRELRQAQAGGLPADVARTVDSFQTALRSRRRLGASIEAGIAPDSNINRANGDATVQVGPATVTLDRDAQATSGVGFSGRGQLFWRPRLTTDLDALATVSVNADLYGASRFNDVATSVAVGPELTQGKTRYRLQGVLGRRWFGGQGYSDTLGATASVRRQVGRRGQLELDLSALDLDYKLNDAMDGIQYGLTLRYERALGTRLYGRATAILQRTDAKAAAFATWTYGGELLISRDLGWLSAYAAAGYYRTNGDAPFVFPPAQRGDDLVTLEGGLVLKGLAVAGFAPVLRVRRLTNRSPVFFYDFHQTRVETTLTREF